MSRLRVGVTWALDNTLQCMAHPASAVCLDDGRAFERFALSRAAEQLELVDLTELEYGVYQNGWFYYLIYLYLSAGTFNGDLGAILSGTVDTLMDTYVMS